MPWVSIENEKEPVRLWICDGNKKTGNIPTFSLPAISTCPGKTPLCTRICYAKRTERRFLRVYLTRVWNFSQVIANHNWWQAIIYWIRERQAKGKPVNYFRIHEGGDFFNQRYLDQWKEIARACPETRFLAFTKSFHLDYSDKPDNLIIYWSVMEDTPKERIPREGLYAYVGHADKEAFPCKWKCDECLYCFYGKGNIVFPRH